MGVGEIISFIKLYCASSTKVRKMIYQIIRGAAMATKSRPTNRTADCLIQFRGRHFAGKS
mgnify:CR=1 FL=1